ncbi:MAG TPA: glycosyltransferase [Burkholderiaceae bacterium]
MKTLWIDCTRTVRSRLHTGIQRYVRATVREAFAAADAGAGGMHVRAICFDGVRFLEVGALEPHPLEAGRSLQGGHNRQVMGKRVDIAAEDIVLLPDAGWYCDYQQELFRLHARGVRLIPVLHDALPASHPHYFREDVSVRFRSYWQDLCDMASAVVCVSRESANALHGGALAPFAGVGKLHAWVNHPGADFLSASVLQDLRPADRPPGLAWAMQQRPTVCVVGTIEPRKNHRLILRASEMLWSGGVDFNLLLIGSVGWLCEDLVEELNRHEQRNQRLWSVHGATDVELAQLMRASNFLLSASSAEGFGLPVAEAAWLGVPVLLSDIPIHREVAPPRHRFFGLNVPELANAIACTLSMWPGPADAGAGGGATIAPVHQGGQPVTWSESVGRLLRWIDQQEQECWSMDDSIECA